MATGFDAASIKGKNEAVAPVEPDIDAKVMRECYDINWAFRDLNIWSAAKKMKRQLDKFAAQIYTNYLTAYQTNFITPQPILRSEILTEIFNPYGKCTENPHNETGKRIKASQRRMQYQISKTINLPCTNLQRPAILCIIQTNTAPSERQNCFQPKNPSFSYFRELDFQVDYIFTGKKLNHWNFILLRKK